MPTAAAQTASDCPPGFECLTPDAEVCLSRPALEQHEEDLREAQDAASDRLGRIRECRDSVEPLQARVEQLAGQVGGLRSRVNQEERRRKTWRTVSLAAGGAAVISSVVLIGDFAQWWDI